MEEKASYAYQAESPNVIYGNTGVMRDATPVNVSYAIEQVHKELSAAHDLLDKLASRLVPVLTSATPRDPGDVKLKSVNNSSPLVGDLMDIRENVARLVGVLVYLDERLTL